MADHDVLCPITTHRGAITCLCMSPDGGPGLIARVRADENMKACRCGCMERDAHAEAVAARLVEVICEQDDLIQIVGVDATNHRAAAADMRRERDAARAERDMARESEQFWNERWQETADQREQYHAERDAARAEVAALRDALEDVIGQACYAETADRTAYLDSMALSAYAHGLRLLAERGRVTIDSQVGRRVIATWVPEEADQ